VALPCQMRRPSISSRWQTLYIATDNRGATAARSGGDTTTLKNPGSILEFKYGG
jgi:hypothetical protein